jgi:hypothetical protein
MQIRVSFVVGLLERAPYASSRCACKFASKAAASAWAVEASPAADCDAKSSLHFRTPPLFANIRTDRKTANFRCD